ncbi:MAG: hypothetical protein RIS45_1264 [Planctomycetota bacterium]|jgi:hypothetical protein
MHALRQVAVQVRAMSRSMIEVSRSERGRRAQQAKRPPLAQPELAQRVVWHPLRPSVDTAGPLTEPRGWCDALPSGLLREHLLAKVCKRVPEYAAPLATRTRNYPEPGR